MSTFTVLTYYTLTRRTMVALNTTDTQSKPLDYWFTHPLYALAQIDGQLAHMYDLTQIVTPASRILGRSGSNSNIQSAITWAMTVNPSLITKAKTAIFPQLDVATGRYLYRVSVSSPKENSGWSIGFGDYDRPDVRDDLNQVGILDDLILTPPKTVTPENILVSVNGVLHATHVVDGVIYVIDGFITIRQSGVEEIVILDTTSLGGHTIVPLTTSNIVVKDDTYTVRALIHDTTVDLSQGAVALSVDGYLQLFNNTYSARDRHSINIDLNLLDLVGNFIYSPIQKAYRDVLAIAQRPNPCLVQETMLNEGVSFKVVPEAETTYNVFNITVNDGSLPPGLSLNQKTGEVSGTPTSAGQYITNFLITTKGFTYTLKLILNVTVGGETSAESYQSVNQGRHVSDRVDPYLYTFTEQNYVDRSTLDSPAFYKARLTSPHSFMIIFNNPNIFLRNFTFDNLGEPMMYSMYSDDTPRGILLYDRGFIKPFTITFNTDKNQHLLFIDNPTHNTQSYLSGENDPTYPSARVDYWNPKHIPTAQLIEVFGPAYTT